MLLPGATVNGLPARTARALAAYWHRLANACEAHADARDREAEARARRHTWRTAYGDTVNMLAIYMTRGGLTWDQAMPLVATTTGADAGELQRLAPAVARKIDTWRRWDRDRTIMRLARQGYTNSEIARHVGLHVQSVARIIARARRLGENHGLHRDAPLPEPTRRDGDGASRAFTGGGDFASQRLGPL